MDPYLVVVVLYPLLLFGLGAPAFFKVRRLSEFAVGGRDTPVAVMVATLVATWTGAGSLLGGAGLAYRQGFSALFMSVGAWCGILLVVFLAPRVRRMAGQTLPEILEHHYGRTARVLGALILAVGAVTIVGYQFKGGAFVLELVAGVKQDLGVVLVAAIVVVLTSVAGLRSVLAADIANGVVMLVGLGTGLVYLSVAHGGPVRALSSLPAGHLSLLGGHSPVWAIAVFFPPLLLLLGEPSMYQKFSSARSPSVARKAAIGFLFGVMLVDSTIATLGALGRLDVPGLLAQGRAERVILDIARHGLPEVAGCLLLAAALAVVLSTANSFLLAASTNVYHDLLGGALQRAQQGMALAMSRLIVVALGALAYLLLTRFSTVLQMALAAYTMIGSALTPVVLSAFFFPGKVPRRATISAMAAGMIATVSTKVLSDLGPVRELFEHTLGIPGDQLGEYIIIPSFLVSVVTLVVCTLLANLDGRRTDAGLHSAGANPRTK